MSNFADTAVSFAQTFEEIFRSIFGRNIRKPHLRRCGQSWECTTWDGKRGAGPTPQTAYWAWTISTAETARTAE